MNYKKKYRFNKSFLKSYKKLIKKQQQTVDNALRLYLIEPFNPILRTHKLLGKFKGQTSISAGGDLRIHLIDDEKIIIVVVMVGSHSKLYK